MDEKVAQAVETSQPTVARVRKQDFEEGLEAALNRRPPKRECQQQAGRRARGPAVQGRLENKIVAVEYGGARIRGS
jgi:hypothetical protein